MTAQYTFLTTDLVTNTVLGEIPVKGVSLDCQLNTPGNMTSGAHLDDPSISNTDFIARTTPGKTAFWAYRNNQIVWGGVIWTRNWTSIGKSFSFTGQTFESYAAKRFPYSVLGVSSVNYNVGQSQIIDQLWQQMQSVQNGSIGVLPYGIYSPSDTVRTVTVNGWDLSQSYDTIIQSILTADQSSPDYSITWQEDGFGHPVKQLVVAPRIGNPAGSTQLVADYPGAVKDYLYNENAAQGANVWYAIGDGSDATIPIGTASDPITLGSGWPLLELVDTLSGVTDVPTLNARALVDLQQQGMPFITHGGDLAGEGVPPFGSYGMGDYFVLNATDPRFPTGAAIKSRVVGWTIVPPDEGTETETITLVYDVPTGAAGA